MNARYWIDQNADILGGKPIIAGRRVSVEMILDRLAAGWSERDIAEAFSLPREAVRTAIAFAAVSVRAEWERYKESLAEAQHDAASG